MFVFRPFLEIKTDEAILSEANDDLVRKSHDFTYDVSVYENHVETAEKVKVSAQA